MPRRHQTIALVPVSDARRAITRARFLAALEAVEVSRLHAPSSVWSLVDGVLPYFSNSPLHTLKPSAWNPEKARTLADRDRKLARVIDGWMLQKNLRVDWVRDAALFTLAVFHHRPSSPLAWRIPPIAGGEDGKSAPFTFTASGWQADFESRGDATGRLRKQFRDALRDYVDTVAAQRGAPGWHGVKKKENEKRGLQWVAVNQVYRWSTSKIAREWLVGKKDRAGGTGRAHVARTIQYWRQILVLSP